MVCEEKVMQAVDSSILITFMQLGAVGYNDLEVIDSVFPWWVLRFGLGSK